MRRLIQAADLKRRIREGFTSGSEEGSRVAADASTKADEAAAEQPDFHDLGFDLGSDERDAPPRTWEAQQSQVEVFTVPPNAPEYMEVSASFFASLQPLKSQPNGIVSIVEIQRVQNLPLWLEYVKTRAQVASKNGGDANEVSVLERSHDQRQAALVSNILPRPTGGDVAWQQNN